MAIGDVSGSKRTQSRGFSESQILQDLFPWALTDVFKNHLFQIKDGLTLSDGADRDTVDIDADRLAIEGLCFSGVDLSCDVTVAGKNGLDTGTVANSTWYSVWVIAKVHGQEIASLASLSATAPLMPEEFVLKRRVGWILRNGSAQNYRFINKPGSNWFFWNEDISAAPFQVLNVTTSVTTFGDVAGSGAAPSTSSCLYIFSSLVDTGTGQRALHLRSKDLSNVDPAIWMFTNDAFQIARTGFVFTDSSQVFQYKTDSTTRDVEIRVAGYEDIR